MKRLLKKVAVGLGIALLVLLLAAVVIAGFFQDAVGEKLIAELNGQLTTELTVGDFELSLLRGFPNATASFQDVIVKGKFGEGLLEAKEMSFHFRLLSLFGSQVKVHSVAIKDGALNVRTDRSGQANYDIFQPTEGGRESNFNIALKTAKLEDIELIYRDEVLEQEMMMAVQEAELAGKFSNKKYDLKSTATLKSHFIDLSGVRYFAGKELGCDAKISVDLTKGTYVFDKVKVFVEDNAFDVEGSVQQQENFSLYDLTATAEDANLASVIALLPEEQLEVFGDFSSRGKFQFSTTINGRLSADENPSVEAALSLDDGKLTHPKLKEPFKDVSFLATFTNGGAKSTRTSSFQISDFKGYLNRELMTMQLTVENMDDPFVDLQADGALPVGYIYGLLGSPAITSGSGELEFQNLRVKGLYRDMLSMSTIIAVEMGGDIGFDDVALKINGEKMTVDRGTLHFQNNLLSLNELKIEGAGGVINLKGSVRNLLPVLFADSINSKQAKLQFTGELSAPEIDLQKLVKLTDIPFDEEDVEEEAFDSLKVEQFAQRERITNFLHGNFTAKVDKFSYGKIQGSNFTGKLDFQNSEMRIVGQADGMDGNFELDGTVFFEQSPRLEAKMSGHQIDVKKFFFQAEDFGQDFIRHDHLKGTMNSKMLVHAFWDSTGNFLMDDLHVWAGLGIRDGELKGFEMLEEFSSYANVSDLRHVVFTDMQNWVEIENGKVTLPVMFIQNNAMNLTVSGEQTFDDKIDYGIKVNAGQVMTNKFKRGNSRLRPIKARRSGFFNLYFNVYGTLDDFDYETNKRKVKDMFARSEKQKRKIRAVLIREFGAPLNMLREPAEWGDEGETANWEDDDDVEYIDGF